MRQSHLVSTTKLCHVASRTRFHLQDFVGFRWICWWFHSEQGVGFVMSHLQGNIHDAESRRDEQSHLSDDYEHSVVVVYFIWYVKAIVGETHRLLINIRGL